MLSQRFASLIGSSTPSPTKPITREMPDWLNHEVSTGTSTLALEFDGGVVLGADTRTSMGAYIPSRATDKITRITDRVYCLRSGSAADTLAIKEAVSYHMEFHEIQTGEPALVKSVAALLQDVCYNYRDQVSAGLIVAGWDSRHGGQVYSVPLGGMLVRQEISLGGSGSTFIYGYVDANFRPKMSREEAENFALNALTLALTRDNSSGGCVRLATITKDGIERKTVLHDELPRFFKD